MFEDRDGVLFELFGRHGEKLSSEDSEREIVVGFYMIPVGAQDFKDTPAHAVSFNCRLGDFFADDNGDAAMHAVFVLAVFEQDSAVAHRLTVAIEVAEAAVAVEAEFMR